MIAVIAEVLVKDGSGPQFEAVATDLAAQVKANEPGNRAYQLLRSKADPNQYRFYELYLDQASLDAHMSSDHFRAAGAKLAEFLSAPPKLELFDEA